MRNWHNLTETVLSLIWRLSRAFFVFIVKCSCLSIWCNWTWQKSKFCMPGNSFYWIAFYDCAFCSIFCVWICINHFVYSLKLLILLHIWSDFSFFHWLIG